MTPQQKRFVQAMVATGDVAYSATKAGYAHPESGYRQLEKAAVSAEIAAESEAMLHNEIVPLALWRLKKILADDDIAPQHHNAAIKIAVTAAEKRVDPSSGKNLSDMTLAETERLLAALKAADARASAQTLEPEPACFE